MINLESGSYYHIYNHANGNEDIFKEERNYIYFLEKYKKYIYPMADTLAYCLMKNHFHLLVKIKDIDKTSDVLKTSDVSNAFKNLFQSYTKSINKEYNRMGSLFNQHFKRKQITSDSQLLNAIIYIHLNPVLHGFVDQLEDWKYSSFNAYLKINGKTLVNTKEGIDYFGDLNNFKACHTINRAEQFED